MTRARMVLTVAAAVLAMTSCGLVGDDDSDTTVTAIRGTELAPPDLRQTEQPAAEYLPESKVLVFVSEPLYSGSCAPSGEAEQDGDGTVTLTIDDDHEGDCTADANRYTFLVQGLTEAPPRLVVEEDGRDDIEIDVS